MITQAELEEARRRSAADFTSGAVAAGFIEAPAPAAEPPPAPPVEEQFPEATNEPPPGGWATYAGRVMGAGWKPWKVDPVLAEILRKREALEQGVRDESAGAHNAPDRVFTAANNGNAAAVAAEIRANGVSMWLDAQSGRASALLTWRWTNDEGRWERYWLFASALVASLVHFEGPDADAVRNEIASVRTHPSPPKPPTIPDIR